MNILLRAKPYILSLITFSPLPFILYMIYYIPIAPPYDFHLIGGFFITLSTLVFILWLYSIGNILILMLEQNINIDIRWFRFNLKYIIGHFLFSWIFSSFSIGGLLFYYSLIAYFQCISVVARLIAHFDSKNNQNSLDYFQVFISIMIFPLGILWIQPRIQKICKENNPV